MKKKLYISLSFLVVFMLFTVAVSTFDVQPIGPDGTYIGFAVLNGYFHCLIGTHMVLYTVTDWLGLIPVACIAAFGILGFAQWVKRKNIRKVDFSILALGGFYIVVLAAYLLFEEFVINYRPILINGYLQASYPSSTTMLTLCVMPTAMMQLKARIKNVTVNRIVAGIISAFTAFMVIGRLVSGVHWLTDIIGGVLLSACLVMGYQFVRELEKK